MASNSKVQDLLPLVERMHRGHCWVKTPNGPRRIDAQLDDKKILEHVTGKRIYGACPIAPGANTCRVAVLDFDSHKGETPWVEMLRVAGDVAFVLEQDGYNPVAFRSSGGQGIHLYLLWDEPQDAHSVREMLKKVLASLGYSNGTAGVSQNQIEIFPKQPSVPSNGYGSMVILPLGGGTKSELLGAL